MKKQRFQAEGYFDCRIYSATLPREQWQLKSESDTLRFVVKTNELTIDGADDFAKQVENAGGTTSYLYIFKVGQFCQFYDKYARAIQRPSVEELDGTRYKVAINFVIKPKDDKTPTKPCGLWADAIMIDKIEFNPFADIAEAIAPELQEVAEEGATQQAEENEESELEF